MSHFRRVSCRCNDAWHPVKAFTLNTELRAIWAVFLGWLRRLKYWRLLKAVNQYDYKLAEQKRHMNKSVPDLLLCVLCSHLQHYKVGHSHFYSGIITFGQPGLLNSVQKQILTVCPIRDIIILLHARNFRFYRRILSIYLLYMSLSSYGMKEIKCIAEFDHISLIICLV